MSNDEVKKIPIHFWLGIILVGIFWTLNWMLDGLRTHWGFFPLWLGYSLVIDGLVFFRTGTSLLKRNSFNYLLLFIFSIPSWWLFESLNNLTQNWLYDGRQFFTNTEYIFLSSLNFSIVMPAVFGTAELVSTFHWTQKFQKKWKLIPTNRVLIICFSSGIIFLALIIIFPRIFYVLIWFAVFMLLEPINAILKNRSIFEFTDAGNWKPLISLALGCIICGFFWEMWNYYSYPKWIYDVPGVNFLHIFEMPVLGYLGYLPFSLELFAMYNFISGLLNTKNAEGYLQL